MNQNKMAIDLRSKEISDREFSERMKEAREILLNHRKSLEKQIPKQWEITTLFAPIQYQKIVKIGRKRYMAHLRSRWDYPFSIAIYELDKKGKWENLIFEDKSVDEADNNPPLKSIKIIERQFAKMKSRKGRIISEAKI